MKRVSVFSNCEMIYSDILLCPTPEFFVKEHDQVLLLQHSLHAASASRYEDCQV